MSLSTKFNKVFFTFFIASLFNVLLISNKIYAQGPKSPEASSFEPVDATDMVNLATGDLSYVLPLLNIPSPEGGYPLALSYHAGITMEQESSWVGLGWTLNPGAINRDVSGQPDDWKDGLNSSMSRDMGGTITMNSFSIGVGWNDDDFNSVGLTANFSSSRAFGGETSHSYSVSASANIDGQSYGIGFSNNGNFSINYNSLSYNSTSGFGVNLSHTVQDVDGNNMSLGVGLSQKSGLGVSLSSSGGSSISIVGDANKASNNNSSVYSAASVGDKFSITAAMGPLRLSYNRQKIRFWHFDEKTYGSTGLLYIGDLHDILSGNDGYDGKVLPYLHAFDSAESTYKSMNSNAELAQNNPTFVSYDQYNIASQGITASMKPYIFNSGLLHSEFNTSAEGKILVNGIERDLEGLYYYNKNDFLKTISSPLINNRINFHIENELSSYFNASSLSNSLWQHSSTYDGDPAIFANTVNIPQNTSQQGFVSSKNRLKQSSYIESYTNQEIISNPNLILETNIDRSALDEDGIGAFKVTVADGKTYHYSIPVYQKEKFSRTTKYAENINDKFYEQQSLSPYATHWLLTEITGPDYIDVNGNNKLDESDFGYWVKFSYGKWSDGFSWRTPATDYLYGSNSKSYSWGVKDLYYLNSIKTRTHTAFFVKEVRQDYNSIKVKVGTSRTNPLSRNSIYYSYQYNLPIYTGSDGEKYFPGAYSTVSTSSAPYSSAGYNVFEITNRQYAESFNHKTLKLKEIILLNNKDIPSTLSMTNSQTPLLASDLKFDENVKIVGDDEYNTGYLTYVDSNYMGQFYSNIIDNYDSDYQALKSKAVKVVNFNYDYSLATNSPNSFSSGKLTLKSVYVNGKSGISLMPPYRFSYNHLMYDQNQIDDWGFKKTTPESGSLSQIMTPTGANIDIQYESDDYAYEAATKNLVIDYNLELKFTGTSSGDKYLEIRNHQNNEARQNIDFRDYFVVGQYEYIDVQYWWNPDHNGDHRIADIAKECLVISVSQNQVKYKLPDVIIGNDVRRGLNCSNESWTFYQWYNEVVSRTSNWRDEEREFECGEPGNDNDKVKIKIFSKLSKANTKGGGVRVKKIIVDGKYTTEHYYNMPNSSISPIDPNYLSSGVTSFSPSKHFKEIPYGNYLPGPGVLYKHVTVVKNDIKNTYQFNVLPKHILNGAVKYSLGNFFQIIEEASPVINLPVTSNTAYSNIPLKKSKFIIFDKLSLLGSLISAETLNLQGQLLLSTKYNYDYNASNIGVNMENFSSLERIYSRPSGQFPTTSDLNLVNTSKVYFPNKLNSVETISNNSKSIISYINYDPITGKLTETSTVSSDGKSLKTKIVPAYLKYPQMGSKVDDITNRNMLSQTAVEYSYQRDAAGNDRVTGVGITTWSNIWSYKDIAGATTSPTLDKEKIWRKHKSYTWNGVVDSEGYFPTTFNSATDDGFVWGVGLSQTNSKWKQLSEVTLYDHFSAQLEMKDINNNFASTKMGDNDTKVMISGNAGYNEMYYSGAENIKFIGGINWLEPNIKLINGLRNPTYTHTGNYSIEANSSTDFGIDMKANEHRAGKYKLSVWVHKANASKITFRLGVGGDATPFNGETVTAGNWVLKTHYFSATTAAINPVVNSVDGSTVYLDDLMVKPVSSSIGGYVYNQWDELTYVIGNNGLATKFEYDEAGRLIKTYSEIVDDSANSITGGFKLKSTHKINYRTLN